MNVAQIIKTCSTPEDWYQRAAELRAFAKAELREATARWEAVAKTGRSGGALQKAERDFTRAEWMLDVADDMEIHALTPRGTPEDYKPGTLISIKRALPKQGQAVWVELRSGLGFRTEWTPGFNFAEPSRGRNFRKCGIEWWSPDNG